MPNPKLLRQRGAAAVRARTFAYDGPRLVAIRSTLGWTQARLAKAFNVGLRTLVRWETEGLRHGPEAVLYGLLLSGAWRPHLD
jgi:DNA-binding transcriptional regulator YiaG